MNTPAFAHAGQRAREILCTAECEREHVYAARQAAWEGVGFEDEEQLVAARTYADSGYTATIRDITIRKAIDRLVAGDIGDSWETYANRVSDDAFAEIDLARLFGAVLWWFVRSAARRMFEVFVWWAIRYFVRLAIEDVKRKLFGQTLDQYGDLPPEQAVAMWGG